MNNIRLSLLRELLIIPSDELAIPAFISNCAIHGNTPSYTHLHKAKKITYIGSLDNSGPLIETYRGSYKESTLIPT